MESRCKNSTCEQITRVTVFFMLKGKKILKNVQFAVFVWQGMGKIKKNDLKNLCTFYAMNCFTLDLGREATQSNYSSTILFRTISFTINMHV